MNNIFLDDCLILEFEISDEKEIEFILSGKNIKIYFGDNLDFDIYENLDKYVIKHNYNKKGNYFIRIYGLLDIFSYCSNNIIKIHNWNNNISNLSFGFYRCSKLKYIPNYLPKNINCLIATFAGCISLENIDISKWNISKNTNRAYMFMNCDIMDKKYNIDWNGYTKN